MFEASFVFSWRLAHSQDVKKLPRKKMLSFISVCDDNGRDVNIRVGFFCSDQKSYSRVMHKLYLISSSITRE